MLADVGLLVLRVVVGGIFVAHGFPKLFGGPGTPISPGAAQYLGEGFEQSVQRGSPPNFARVVQRIGAPEPTALAWFVACLEFFGGIMLAIGWLTRVVAFLLAGEMAVAIRKVHWQNGLIGQGGFELPLAMLGACLTLVGTGPGRISIDGATDP